MVAALEEMLGMSLLEIAHRRAMFAL